MAAVTGEVGSGTQLTGTTNRALAAGSRLLSRVYLCDGAYVLYETDLHLRQVQHEVVSDCEEAQIMQFVVVGIFGSFGDAEAAVHDLESAGIIGEQVKVISDIDQDARTANIPGEPATKPHEALRSRLARLLGSGDPVEKHKVRGLAGEQPNYIGAQAYYATHLKKGGAVLIVRTSAEHPASGAAAILRNHGARTPGHKGGPAVQHIN
jgi:hypothetical protein